ncbi:TSUP family transporter [Herbaspirillum sp. WKF16]|uniref:TSUP family transporter n=1 Tax=Herbaspirillum sp. WKF16 TaxID=3028312 RepID=UPI0023A91703|nr:TSUP family transporter [Herbaspirillum sp. WKF16]WDZ97831.1 TSUP family transporter [Herbaspirillum sp. WKF16]
MNFYLALAAFGLLSGCAISLLRTGSGTVVVPLMYCSLTALYPAGSALHRMAMHVAVGTSACVLAITAAAACRPYLSARRISLRKCWPLCLYAATGALAGALAALACSPFRLRLLYVLYLSALIADCALRFDRMEKTGPAHGILPPSVPRRLPLLLNACAVLAAGSLSAGAGVGGGAMTVPLMRRGGHDAECASALSQLLAASAALAACAVYLAAAGLRGAEAGAWHVGHVDLSAAALLAVAALAGMRLARPLAGSMPERMRVGAYMGLLLLVLFKMTV